MGFSLSKFKFYTICFIINSFSIILNQLWLYRNWYWITKEIDSDSKFPRGPRKTFRHWLSSEFLQGIMNLNVARKYATPKWHYVFAPFRSPVPVRIPIRPVGRGQSLQLPAFTSPSLRRIPSTPLLLCPATVSLSAVLVHSNSWRRPPGGAACVKRRAAQHFTSINQNAPQSRHNPTRAGCNFCEGDTRGIQGGSLLAP